MLSLYSAKNLSFFSHVLFFPVPFPFFFSHFGMENMAVSNGKFWCRTIISFLWIPWLKSFEHIHITSINYQSLQFAQWDHRFMLLINIHFFDKIFLLFLWNYYFSKQFVIMLFWSANMDIHLGNSIFYFEWISHT